MANLLRIDSHGGSCCGIRHIHCFYSVGRLSVEEIKIELADAVRRAGSAGVYEVVLTNSQMKNKRTVDALQEFGFELVSRFKNPNSSSICNVFHYYKKNSKRNMTRIPNWKVTK
jgi:hypothetical protein